MNCRDFEAAWNLLLDAETPDRHDPAAAPDLATSDLPGRERALRAHAESCPRCRAAQEGFLTLRRALRACHSTGSPLAGPSPALIDRVVTDAGGQTPAWRRRRILIPLILGAAASLLGLWFSPLNPNRPRLRPEPGPVAVQFTGTVGGPAPSARPPRASSLSVAMADVTGATWDLARTASGPATRTSLRLLEAATLQDGEPPATRLPSVFRAVAPAGAGADLLQDVGDGLSDGVRPLSSLAREAFSFLRTPSLDRTRGRALRPSTKGA
ncbi:MAG: hypothetical protein U0790_21155 [Isosphaeraceae bacterium]